MSVKFKHPLLSRRSLIAAAPGLAFAAAAGNRAVAQEAQLPDAVDVFNRIKPQPVPPLKFTNAQGKLLSLADYKGHPLVVNLWATWCPPCGMELPSLDGLAPRLAKFGGLVLAISVDEDGRQLVPQFYKQAGIKNLPVLLNPSGDDLDALNTDGIPATLVVDPQGLVVASLDGAADWNTDGVVAFVKALVAPPEKKEKKGGVTQV